MGLRPEVKSAASDSPELREARERRQSQPASDSVKDAARDLAMAQNPNRTPSEHPNPTTKID